MGEKPPEESVVSVQVPPTLDEWLDSKAAELDVSRDVIIVQLLASYRAATELDDEVGSLTDVEDEVQDVIDDRLPEITNAVSQQIDTGDDIDTVERRIESDISQIEGEFNKKLQDVRERVIQVKQEVNEKAPADHSHSEVDDLSTVVEDVQVRLDDIATRLEEGESKYDQLEMRIADIEDATERLDEIEDQLQTTAWVVSNLRDTVDDEISGRKPIDSLKQSAAEADADRAVCEHCNQAVDIALLTESRCPHCETTVTDVKLPGRFFGKPKLITAHELEAGEED